MSYRYQDGNGGQQELEEDEEKENSLCFSLKKVCSIRQIFGVEEDEEEAEVGNTSSIRSSSCHSSSNEYVHDSFCVPDDDDEEEEEDESSNQQEDNSYIESFTTHNTSCSVDDEEMDEEDVEEEEEEHTQQQDEEDEDSNIIFKCSTPSRRVVIESEEEEEDEEEEQFKLEIKQEVVDESVMHDAKHIKHEISEEKEEQALEIKQEVVDQDSFIGQKVFAPDSPSITKALLKSSTFKTPKTPNKSKHRQALCSRLFRLFQRHVFENKLPDSLNIQWSNHLKTTAGYFQTRLLSIELHSHIELSSSICNSAGAKRRSKYSLALSLCPDATTTTLKKLPSFNIFVRAVVCSKLIGQHYAS
uniref:SprT-like domain-containing protein n=1 Tax=Ditylenchus dipsaci TaxID=166011 RepID=A0A915EGQ1_9BILA